MMIYPPVTELVKKTGSRYALVVETAKRARQLVDGSAPLSVVDSNKEVTMAVNEIYEDRIGVIEAKAENNSIENKLSAIKAAISEANLASAEENSDENEVDIDADDIFEIEDEEADETEEIEDETEEEETEEE